MSDRSVGTVWTHRLGTCLVLFALLVAGCGGSDASEGDTAPSVTEPDSGGNGNATSTTSSPEGAAVVAAYEDFWDAYLEAADPMDPAHPVLAEHAVNPQLERLQRSFLARRSSGEVIRGTLDLAPELISVEGGTARVSDCYADSTGVYDAETGERKDTPSGVRHRITADVVLDGAVWKVSDITREGDGCDPS